MAQIILEVKDTYLAGVGARFGNRNDPAEAIRAALQDQIDKATVDVIESEDPDVVQKRQEYEAVLEQKKQETKDVKEGR